MGLKLKVVLKWEDSVLKICMVPLMAGLKMEGIFKWRGLKSEGLDHCVFFLYFQVLLQG